MAVFYRVVSPVERDDILATGELRRGPNSMDGKHLWGTFDHAKLFAESLLRRGWESECIIFEVEVSDAQAKDFEYLDTIDEIGPAWFASIESLENATVRIIE